MPDEIYNSDDYCNLAEEFEQCKGELDQWKWAAKALSKELTEMREKYESTCWEDIDESSHAQILYKMMVERKGLDDA